MVYFPKTIVVWLSVVIVVAFQLRAQGTRPDPSPASVALQGLLDKQDYPELARSLPRAVGLKPEERLYFRGMLNYAQGRFGAAIQPLVTAVNTVDYALTSLQVEQAIETLGDNYTKMFRYKDAVKNYDIVDSIFGARMGDAINPVREKRAIAAALQNVPPQTVTNAGDFTLIKTGLEYPISIGGREFSATIDTGAAFSMISESTAKNWDVNRLEGTVTFHGYGAGEISAQPAVVPVLQIGKAELQNVAVFITADKNMILSKAILGYPVVAGLGRLTFGKDRTLTIGVQSPNAGTDNEAPLWVGYSSLQVSVNTAAGGAAPRTFMLDTGSLSTILTDRFLEEHRTDFSGKPNSEARLAGLDGVHVIPAYSAKQLPLWFGSTRVLLNGQNILTESQGGEVEKYFGLIGQDLLQQFSSYTIDFRAMRFSAAP